MLERKSRTRLPFIVTGWTGVQEAATPRARLLARRLGLARLACIVAAALLVAPSGPAFAQSGTGCTGRIEGAIRLVESPGGPVCSIGTTGPHDAFGARTIGQILEVEGFNLPAPYTNCASSLPPAVASQPGIGDFPPTQGCGPIMPVGSPSSRYEATYYTNAQVSDDYALDYTVRFRVPSGVVPGQHFLGMVRHVDVPPPCPPIGDPLPVFPNQDLEMVPAVVRLSYRLEDGLLGSGDTSVWYGYGDAVPYPPHLTPAQIASTVIIDRTGGIGEPDIIAHGADTSTDPPGDLEATLTFPQTGDVGYRIVPAGHTITLAVGASTVDYVHPTLGPIEVPMRGVIGNVAIDFDVDGIGGPDTIPARGILSVNIPVAGRKESCALFPIDVVSETEARVTATIRGGQPGGFDRSQTVSGPLDGPTQVVLEHLLPKIYDELTADGLLERPPTASGFPFSGTASVWFPRTESHEVDAGGYPLTGEAATGFDTRPGYSLPAGPQVPDQCVDFGRETNTGAPFQALVITPTKFRGRVLLADAGTPIDQVSQVGPTLIEAITYQNDDPNMSHVTSAMETKVEANSMLNLGGFSQTEPIPHQDTSPLSPRYGKYFIDRTNNTALGRFELPALDVSVSPAPPLQNPWITNALYMNLLSGSPDTTLDEDYINGTAKYFKREPSSPSGPPRNISPLWVYPAEAIAGQDFDVCLGLIQVTLTERAEDDQNPGHPKRFFLPIVSALAQRGYLFDDYDPEGPLSPSEIGGPLTSGGFSGTPLQDQPASQGRVNLILPAGRYTLQGSYFLENGGTTTIPSITGTTGVIVGCGQVVSISNQLSISALVPSCSATGSFTLAGNAFSTPDPPQGASEVAAAQVATISYTVNGGAPVVLDPTVHRNPPAPEWGLQPAFAAPVSLPGSSCTPYSVVVTATTQAGNTATSQGLATYDDGAPPAITACPAMPIALSSCTTGGSVAFDLDSLVTGGQLAASDSSCPATPFWNFAPHPGSFLEGETTSIEATASDKCGNDSSCTFDVSVACDPTPPAITCPGPISVTDTDLDGFETVSFAEQVAASDDCNNASLSFDHPSPSAFPVGTTTVHATATNGCGLEDSCDFDVTVRSGLPACEDLSVLPPQCLGLCPDPLDQCTFAPSLGHCACRPLVVSLESFTAETTARGAVRLRWTTIAERDNLGFRVLRGLEGQEPVVVSALIPARGTSLAGAQYEYLDTERKRPGATYRYYLEDLDTEGTLTRRAGPLEVRIAPLGRADRGRESTPRPARR